MQSAADCKWTDPALVGDSAYPTYLGRPVVAADPTLLAFKNYMQAKTFTFTYDHAVGLFKYVNILLNHIFEHRYLF